MELRTRIASAVLIAVTISVLAAGRLYAPPTFHPFGVTLNKAGLVYPGYVLYNGPDGIGRLIDQNGALVHRWISPRPGFSLQHVRPLADGHILARVVRQTSRTVVEMDWDGNVIWEFEAPPGVLLHHDHSKLPNGNYLLLCSRDLDIPAISNETITDDCLLEVDANGQIVWDWQTADHFDDFMFDPEVAQLIFEAGGDWAHANAAAAIPVDTSHGDPRFQPGNVILSYRFISAVAIVDRQTDDIVWLTDNSTNGQHDSHMLPDSLPGGGNILVFDNGFGEQYDLGSNPPRPYSTVIEIDPTDFSEPYEYTASNSGRPVWTFFSWFISGAQRLPNGNTLIDEGAFGRIFEVTPSGELVWEYVNRAHNSAGTTNTRVYRAHKVELDWPPV